MQPHGMLVTHQLLSQERKARTTGHEMKLGLRCQLIHEYM